MCTTGGIGAGPCLQALPTALPAFSRDPCLVPPPSSACPPLAGPARTPLASGHLERLQGGHRAPAPGEPYSSPATDFISRVSARLPHPSPAPSSQASSLSSLLSRLQELVALQAAEVPPAEVVADPHARVRFEAQRATPSPFLQVRRGSAADRTAAPPPQLLGSIHV